MILTSEKDQVKAYVWKIGRRYGGQLWENGKLTDETNERSATDIIIWAKLRGAQIPYTTKEINWSKV